MLVRTHSRFMQDASVARMSQGKDVPRKVGDNGSTLASALHNAPRLPPGMDVVSLTSLLVSDHLRW
jgi:hypothetical protein